MTDYPFIYICSHAGKIGNIRWVNSDTRWPDWIHKRWIGHVMRRGHWGRVGYVDPCPDEDNLGSLSRNPDRC
jgi:hypothetical protein